MTRKQRLVIDLFSELPTMTDPPVDNTVTPSPSLSTLTNPYAQEIDLSSKHGLTLFLNMTKGLAEASRYDLSLDDTKKRNFWSNVVSDCSTFDFRPVTLVPDASGNRIDLLDHHADLELDDVMNEGNTLWGVLDIESDTITEDSSILTKEIYQKRIRASAMGQYLLNSLTPEAKTRINIHKHQFTYKYKDGRPDVHGPSILFLIAEIISPSSRVGAEHLEEELKALQLSDFGGDVPKALDRAEQLYQEILAIDHETGKSLRYVKILLDLLSSGTVAEFTAMIAKKKSKWQRGKTITVKHLRKESLAMWNNLEASAKTVTAPKSLANAKPEERTTPPDAASFYTALTSELKSISEKLSNGGSRSTGNTGSNGGSANSSWSRGYQEWRKKKIDGKETIEMEGRLWHWVPEFVCPRGTFSGMYMTHKPGTEHEEWLRKKKYWADKKRRRGTGDASERRDPPPAAEGGNEPKLIPSEKLKQALMTSHGMMEMQADAFLASLN